MDYLTIMELVKEAEKHNCKISDIVLREQSEAMELAQEILFAKMEGQLDVMLQAIENGTSPDIRSTSGLTGGDAYKLYQKEQRGESLSGPLLSNGIRMAMAVSELNASMGQIVASPTAGSCGILPGAIGACLKVKNINKDVAVKSLFTAGAIGMVVANAASISGAEGGCQAECGTASAMAAGSVVEMMGGSPTMVANAVAIALKCILGLVCDPVAGLVEVPCIKRNASGVSLAFTASELALSDIKSYIPVDEVIQAMRKVGHDMSESLKETAEGGLACTKTGRLLREQIFGKS